MVNVLTIDGYVGADPILNKTQTGEQFFTFSIANSDFKKNKESPNWFKVCVFNEKLAEKVYPLIKKGDKIVVVGSLQTRERINKESKRETIYEVIISKYNSVGSIVIFREPQKSSEMSFPANSPTEPEQAQGIKTYYHVDDDVPF